MEARTYDIPERLVFLVQWVPVSDEDQDGSLVAKVVPEWGWAVDGGWQVEFWGLRPWRRPPRPGDRLTVRGLRCPRVGQPLLSLAANTVHFLLLLRRRRPGILLGAGGWGISGAAVALRLTGHRAPLIVKVNVHSEGDGMARRGHRVAPRIILGVERFVFRTADLVTTVGASTSRFAADAGVVAERIIQRSAAVSGGLLTPPPEACRDPMLIACVARLEPRKAVDVLLRAVAEVRTAHPAVKVEIAGLGGQRNDLEALAAGLDIANCVMFHGSVPRPDIPALLARATVFVLPSRADEACPRSWSRRAWPAARSSAPTCGAPTSSSSPASRASWSRPTTRPRWRPSSPDCWPIPVK